MADVSINPESSNPKELYGQGVKAYVLQDYDTAVRAFSRASELLAAEHGNDTHDSLGDVYLYYGKSLLELSRKESGPLGEGVLKNVEEESESEETEEVEGEEEETKTEEPKASNGEPKEEKPTDEPETEEAPAETEEAPAETEDTEEANGSTEKKEGETEDELTDLQVAWEVLELAKSIFTARGPEGRKYLAETLITLGEISLESGNYPSAVDDIKAGLEIQKTLFANDSRTIAETFYKLGGAYSTNAQIDEAIESFNSSYEYLKNKVASLEKDGNKEANAEEIEEINTLMPEIQEKVADMKSLKDEIAKKVTASATEAAPKVNGAAEASSSKQINNISHLVKRKRKDDEAPKEEEKPAKRPSP